MGAVKPEETIAAEFDRGVDDFARIADVDQDTAEALMSAELAKATADHWALVVALREAALLRARDGLKVAYVELERWLALAEESAQHAARCKGLRIRLHVGPPLLAVAKGPIE